MVTETPVTSSLKVRPAVPSDRAPLMEFIKHVWGGHDYIPYVWDDWLLDKSGRMFVVDLGGVPVAMNRVKFVEDGSAWFEGVRVHPRYRGKGIATMLGDNSIRIAKGRGIHTYRLTSSSWNHKAHRQVARMDFREIARVSVYEARKGDKHRRHREVRRAGSEDLGRVVDMVKGSKEFKLGAGVMWDGYTAIALTRDVIRGRVQGGDVYLCGDALAVGAPGREGRNAWSQVCFLTGGKEDATKLVESIFAEGKGDTNLVYLPQGSRLIHQMRASGLRRAYSLILFEKKSFNG